MEIKFNWLSFRFFLFSFKQTNKQRKKERNKTKNERMKESRLVVLFIQLLISFFSLLSFFRFWFSFGFIRYLVRFWIELWFSIDHCFGRWVMSQQSTTNMSRSLLWHCKGNESKQRQPTQPFDIDQHIDYDSIFRVCWQ